MQYRLELVCSNRNRDLLKMDIGIKIRFFSEKIHTAITNTNTL